MLNNCLSYSTVQQEVIGQNLVDITHAESGAEIAACLKPSIVPVVAESIRMEGESSISQFRQFYVKFKPTPKSTSYPVSSIVVYVSVFFPSKIQGMLGRSL